MKYATSLLLSIFLVCAVPAHANPFLTVNIVLLKHDRENARQKWANIEAKRKNFLAQGNAKMSQMAAEEAAVWANRYNELDAEVKHAEDAEARNSLSN